MVAKAPLRLLAWPSGARDELNPYVRLIYSAFRRPEAEVIAFRPFMRTIPSADVFHVHWPEGIFEGRGGANWLMAWMKGRRVLGAADRIRKNGGLLALTVHNIEPHRNLSPWQRRIWSSFHKAFLSRVDLLVGLSSGGVEKFRSAYPDTAGAQAVVIPHPHYRGCYPPVRDRRLACCELGLDPDCSWIGVIGSMRPSKRVPHAISEFRATESRNLGLLVAGSCSDDHWRDVLAAAGTDPRVQLRRGNLSDDQLATAFSAIDVCLINQPEMLNSGTALLSLSFDRPLIAPNVGSLSELQHVVGDGWVRLMPADWGVGDLSAACRTLVSRRARRCQALDRFDPERLSRQLLDAFRGWLEHHVR